MSCRRSGCGRTAATGADDECAALGASGAPQPPQKRNSKGLAKPQPEHTACFKEAGRDSSRSLVGGPPLSRPPDGAPASASLLLKIPPVTPLPPAPHGARAHSRLARHADRPGVPYSIDVRLHARRRNSTRDGYAPSTQQRRNRCAGTGAGAAPTTEECPGNPSFPVRLRTYRGSPAE